MSYFNYFKSKVSQTDCHPVIYFIENHFFHVVKSKPMYIYGCSERKLMCLSPYTLYLICFWEEHKNFYIFAIFYWITRYILLPSIKRSWSNTSCNTRWIFKSQWQVSKILNLSFNKIQERNKKGSSRVDNVSKDNGNKKQTLKRHKNCNSWHLGLEVEKNSDIICIISWQLLNQ